MIGNHGWEVLAIIPYFKFPVYPIASINDLEKAVKAT